MNIVIAMKLFEFVQPILQRGMNGTINGFKDLYDFFKFLDSSLQYRNIMASVQFLFCMYGVCFVFPTIKCAACYTGTSTYLSGGFPTEKAGNKFVFYFRGVLHFSISWLGI